MNKELYQYLTNTSMDAYFVMDLAGNILDVNSAATEMYGYSRDELLSLNIDDLEVQESEEDIRHNVEKVIADGFGRFESQHYHKSGKVIEVEVSSAFVPESRRFLSFYRDISERRHAEQSLLESESFLRKVQRVARIGIYDYDISNDAWESSPELDSIFGIEKTFTRDFKGWLSLIHPDYRDKMAAYFSDLITSKTWFDMEYKIIRPSDSLECWMYGTGEFSYDSNGKAIRMYGTIQDITELKNAEQNKLALEQQLLHAQKLESLGVLAGGIAHDFNNILTAIVGNTELALLQLPAESPAQDNLLRIEKAAIRATELAKQMLAYSGRGKFVIETIDLNRLIEEMGRILEVSISKKVILRYNFTSNLPKVKVDATQLRQVLMNLVINASEAIGETEGVVAISTGSLHCDTQYLRDIWRMEQLVEGVYVFLEVTDTGCGMSREVIDKLFDPFFTTKFTGRGLGMSAVMGIVRGHHGVIKLQSDVGKGTSFQILLPADTSPGEVSLPDESSTNWHGEGTVLLVDDEETVRDIGCEMLKNLGYEVVTAANGLQALDIVSARQDIKLVILDLTMPQMDGMQCLKSLHANMPELKVIMSSGYNEQEVTKQLGQEGLAGFIQKPYRLAELKTVLKQV